MGTPFSFEKEKGVPNLPEKKSIWVMILNEECRGISLLQGKITVAHKKPGLHHICRPDFFYINLEKDGILKGEVAHLKVCQSG